MRKTLGLLAIASAISSYAHPGIAADDRVRQWVSPDHLVTVSSVAVRHQYGMTFYELRLARTGRKPVSIDEYHRDVDVLFSSDSKYVAVTDWIGSNVADCYLVDTNKPKRRVSITDKVPKLQEDLSKSHSYVSCNNWLSAKTIDVQVSGHTDYEPLHWFKYRFAYDVGTGRLEAADEAKP